MTEPTQRPSTPDSSAYKAPATGKTEKPCAVALNAVEKLQEASTKKPISYKTNWFQRIILKVAMSDVVFGTFTQRSQENIDQEYVKLDGENVQVLLASGDMTLTGKKFGIDEKRPTALILSGSFAPAGRYVAPIVQAYLDEGYNVLVVDPVGFGENRELGRPDPENFMASSEASAKFVREHMQPDPEKIVVHGYSLGGFAATHVAALEENSGMHVVLDRVSSSNEKVASTVIENYFSGIIGKILGYIAGKITKFAVPFDLKKELDQVKGKVLVVQADSINPDKPGDQSAEKFVATSTTIKKVHEVGRHITGYNDTWIVNKKSSSCRAWQEWLKKDIQTHLPPMDNVPH